ncbi:hypothetical protein OH76DRAFT_1255080 [Lentinus brumalis]|uniref:F-box domain-containing protein n=1 Tax=Lentinus brumalis TaxID=2498619 RepID=A0A371CRM3_9APHY|nr:hypothetical protein OH76DRAFT_1255080 [Polyporus brumalis]
MSDIALTNLHPDILCTVMEFVANDEDGGISTISIISRTCKRMRFEGTKYLLSGIVELSSIKRVCSFCQFMLADKSTRLPLLKGLVLILYSIEEEEHVRLVCETVRGLSNLYELDVTLGATSSPSALREIPAAIASLTSLGALTLAVLCRFTSTDTSDPVFVTALKNTRAPLMSLSINLGTYTKGAEADRVRYNRKRDPIFLCSRLRSTLERLEVSGRFTLIVRPGRTYEYPRLHQVILPLYHICRPYLKPIIVSAPQLRDLQFGGRYNTHMRHRHDEDILRGRVINSSSTPQEWRTVNQRDQEAMGKSWSMLDAFKGAIIGAYATGLACPVTRVHLLSTGGRRTLELTMLSIVLSDWRPSFLRLATKVYRARGYIPLVPSTSSGWAESLETLEIRLNIVDDRFDYAECFVSLSSP